MSQPYCGVYTLDEKQVRTIIGDEAWPAFDVWIQGQTVGIYPDGNIDYYDWDVLRFKRHYDGIKVQQKET